MVRFWVVVGDGDTRKSATVRALTGVSKAEQHWQVAYSGWGNQRTYVELSGLQEQQPVYCQPRDFIDRVEAAGVDYAILALRHNAVRHRPDAATYISAFIKHHWQLEHIGITGANYGPSTTPLAMYLPRVTFVTPQVPRTAATRVATGAMVMPPNEIAGQLRPPFGLL